MSCIPSFLLVSLFLYGLFIFGESGRKWFLLSFVAAISFWVRETNLVLLGSICLIHFSQDKRWFLFYFFGALIGFLPRLISSTYYYGDPFYYVLAEAFSIQNVINNIGVYAILFLCFMPLGLWFLVKYRGPYFKSLLISTLLFLGLYCSYSFNATAYSGFYKGIILMGRFMMPILPIFIISVGWYFRKKTIPKPLKLIAFFLVLTMIVVMQALLYQEAKIHKKISDHIYSNYSDRIVLYDLSRTTNIVRYINPFHGTLPNFSDISNLNDDDYVKTMFNKYDVIFLMQTINTGNSDKQKYTSKIDGLVNQAMDKYNAEEVERIKIKPSLYLQIVKIRDGVD